MVQDVLNNLQKPIGSLKGIGPNLALLIKKAVRGEHLKDLLFHLPSGLSHRILIQSPQDQPPGTLVTFRGVVKKHQKASFTKGQRQPYRVYVQLGQNMISLCFFNARIPYLMGQLPLDQNVVISGKLELFKGQWQITHPDHIGALETLSDWVGTNPIYPLTQGLTQRVMRKAITIARSCAPKLEEWISPEVLKWHKSWMPWQEAIQAVHLIKSEEELLPSTSTRERLAYDELLSNQIMLQLSRAFSRRSKGISRTCDTSVITNALAHLPFSLTQDQQKTLEEILSDMARPVRMNRLVQGDVGSGKTVVAFLAAVVAKAAGYQTAFLAPTEILARQHLETLKPLADACGLTIALLTGKDTKKVKKPTLEGLASGAIDLVIGTHALIQEEVAYKKLGLAIVDEQHRFGVDQRLALMHKGEGVDLLSMTATPIPRTLMLTAYGDMDSSQIRQKPAGRQEIQTKTIALSRLTEITAGLERALQSGHKIYWVCPLVEESEKLDLAAAQGRYEHLEALFPGQVGLVHGRMKTAEKDAVMKQFIDSSIRILIATTVIEVGVNVTDATIMVIEHAERFGLAQLHQLRGRIGRGEQQGTCILLHSDQVSDAGRARLTVMRSTTDGFAIAEEDWRLRGGGEILGVRQSGLPDFKFVDWSFHQPLLKQATHDARQLIDEDPELKKSHRGRAARVLLDLFDRTDSTRYLGAG